MVSPEIANTFVTFIMGTRAQTKKQLLTYIQVDKNPRMKALAWIESDWKFRSGLFYE